MKVVHLTSVYPLANAACERGFSTMKTVKSDWCCALRTNTMDKYRNHHILLVHIIIITYFQSLIILVIRSTFLICHVKRF